ncbi:biotin synthetase [Salmonella enterica subsp. diarizonae]|uniref:Biotin synthetase n=1 Tax=Salmonella diarizonae TaxID=59204 RepID=A0A379U2R6_SALDZ|nr:biotin synthetase [Salmonella enterica subsp. diarizonae]
MMPTSYVRLSAGREQMNEQTQAMCFMPGELDFLWLQIVNYAKSGRGQGSAVIPQAGTESAADQGAGGR